MGYKRHQIRQQQPLNQEVFLCPILYKNMDIVYHCYMEYRIGRYDKFKLTDGRDTIQLHTVDNNCTEIEIGDTVILREGTYEVTNLEWFKKSFGMTDESVSLIIREI